MKTTLLCIALCLAATGCNNDAEPAADSMASDTAMEPAATVPTDTTLTDDCAGLVGQDLSNCQARQNNMNDTSTLGSASDMGDANSTLGNASDMDGMNGTDVDDTMMPPPANTEEPMDDTDATDPDPAAPPTP